MKNGSLIIKKNENFANEKNLDKKPLNFINNKKNNLNKKDNLNKKENKNINLNCESNGNSFLEDNLSNIENIDTLNLPTEALNKNKKDKKSINNKINYPLNVTVYNSYNNSLNAGNQVNNLAGKNKGNDAKKGNIFK